MQSESNNKSFKEDNNYFIQWMASDFEDINSNDKIRQTLDRWKAKNPAYKNVGYGKSDLLDYCRYLGLGSVVLKAAKLNLKISRAVFTAEHSRLSFDGNLGWSKNESLEILRKANDNGLLEDVPEFIINQFESKIRADKNIINLDNKSIVWFPIVDLKTDMVMFDACYYNKMKGKASSCYASAGVTNGNSNELALLIQEFISSRYCNKRIWRQYIATGTLISSEDSFKVGKVDKIIPKLKAALDFGIIDIFAPLDNKEECDLCKVLYEHPHYRNIHWVDNIKEVTKLIHRQFDRVYFIKPDSINNDEFARQIYQSTLSEENHKLQITDNSEKVNENKIQSTNTSKSISNDSIIVEYENRISKIKEYLANNDKKSAYLAYEELEKACKSLLEEDDNRFFKSKYYKIKCLYFLFKDKELYSVEKFSSELEAFVSRFEKSKRIVDLRLIDLFSLVCRHYVNKLFRNYKNGIESFNAIYDIYKRIVYEDDPNCMELCNCWVDILVFYRFRVINHGTVGNFIEHGNLLYDVLPDKSDIKERLVKLLIEMAYFANDSKLSNEVDLLLNSPSIKVKDTFVKNIREITEKNNILYEIVSQFRHETKSTLANINRCIKKIDEFSCNEDDNTYSGQIRSHCDILKSNVQDLVYIMDFISNRKPSGDDFVEISIKELIDDYIKNSGRPKIFKVRTLSKNNGLTFPIVKSYFFIALNNFIKNSLEAYKENKIAKNKQKIEFIIDYSSNRLIIQDHAGGIKVKDREKIFEHYFSTKTDMQPSESEMEYKTEQEIVSLSPSPSASALSSLSALSSSLSALSILTPFSPVSRLLTPFLLPTIKVVEQTALNSMDTVKKSTITSTKTVKKPISRPSHKNAQSRGIGMTQIKKALSILKCSFGFAEEQPSDGTAFYIQF